MCRLISSSLRLRLSLLGGERKKKRGEGLVLFRMYKFEHLVTLLNLVSQLIHSIPHQPANTPLWRYAAAIFALLCLAV
jgi:hypothetical protein